MEEGADLHAVSISDVAAVRALLIAAAKGRRATSYAGLLDQMGHRFSRPKMRALCKTLDKIDDAARAAGEPELAVLVVRESDRLPGQGWWVGCAQRLGYDGLWSGPDAVRFIKRQQKRAFDYWCPGTRAAGKASAPSRKRRASG